MKRLLPLSIIAALTILAAALFTAGGPLRARGIALTPVVLAGGDTLDVSGDSCRVRSAETNGVLHARCVDWTPTPTRTPSVSPATATNTPFSVTSTPVSMTATNTPTPSATAPVSTPTDTPAVAPSSSPTATPTRGPAAPFALGIRLDKGDAQTLAAWNAHALPIDSEHSQGANAAMVLAAHGTDRAIECGGAAVAADSCRAAIADAVAAHIPDLGVNDEGPPCSVLQADEVRVYALAHAAGLTMTWVPTGHMLHDCPSTLFVTNTDRVVYQVEALEQDPSINFAPYVHDEIALLHMARPDLPIAVQVSVNPPHNRTATAAQTLADIAALENGSVNAPFRVDVFYYARSRDATRADVMLAVVAALRP